MAIKRLVTLLALAMMSCAWSSSAAPPSGDPPRTVETVRGSIGEQADQILRTAAADGFGGAAIIEIDGEIVFAGSYGYADREAGIPFTIDTVAQIGSITKTFTGAAIADLVRRGLVDLDQTAGHYLVGAPEPGASVPLRKLLSHRSGMREYCGDDFDRRTASEVKSVCMALPLDQEISPEDGGAYSNVGYSVLGAIVEQVSGETLEHYVATRLLAPAGIDGDGYGRDRGKRRHLAAGYDHGVRQAPISETLAPMRGHYWNLKGNGGMQMSPRDMYRWHQTLTCRAPLDQALRKLIVRPVVEAAGDVAAGNGSLVSRGYGWAFRTTPNGTPYKLTHGGSDGVFAAQYVWLPYGRVFLYVVGNSGEDDVQSRIVALRLLVGDGVKPTDQSLAGRADPWICSE